MSNGIEEQISQWLKKLERESWQLELLVSAFTIFLLIGASESFGEALVDMRFSYSLDGWPRLLMIFLISIHASIRVLTGFLVIHLLLRGFWIGTIGLRSVQPSIDYDKLNYSSFFQKKLTKRLVELDRLVVVLDELCSIIFSLSFLIIFMILSFGLYIVFLGSYGVLVSAIIEFTGSERGGVLFYVTIVTTLAILLSSLIYLIDYFSLGFFKKWNRFGKIYYPVYKFYSLITLSFISRSIYYSLISKFSKKKIRIMYLLAAVFIFSGTFVNFDQFQYYPMGDSELILSTNFYDDTRPEDDYVEKASVSSRFLSGSFTSLFLRYNPEDNEQIRSNCPDFVPVKNDGFNATITFRSDSSSTQIGDSRFMEEDGEMLLSCLSAYYEVSINDSVYADQKFFFYEHPTKSQKGLITVISTRDFIYGENLISVKKRFVSEEDSTFTSEVYANIPVWFSE